MRFSSLVRALAFVAACALPPAQASIWIENNAGELPGTAEITTGAGPLSELRGNLAFDLVTSQWQVDLYAISIVDPLAFSARTVGGLAGLPDPVLFLFGADGRGVYMNDDASNVDLQAMLPAGHASGPLTTGLYYLAIAWAFSDPLSDSGAIFPLYELFLDTAGVYGPTGSGGADPLTSWIHAGPPNFDLPSSYRILLTGAAAALQVPEPAALALLALGIALAHFPRRRAA